jgi:glutamate carboxypeptidase
MQALALSIQEKANSRREEILGFLEDLVSINSYSRNYEGINEAGNLVRKKMPESLHHKVTSDRNGVNHHLFSSGIEEPGKNLVLVGHTDTVFPPDTDSRAFEIVSPRIFGAGVTDMKAGVVVIVCALRILDELGLLSAIPLKCLINGDEEIGSPHSRPLLDELSSWADWGLVYEGGGRNNEVVYARRGIRRYRLTVTGEAHHAGVWKGPKASAILELSYMIQALEDLNDEKEGLSLNVGKISGGTTTNVIPDLATASFEFRFWNRESEKQTLARIEAVVENPLNPKCEATLKCHHQRPAGSPIEGTGKLYDMVLETADVLGQQVGKEKRGGTSDANFLIAGGVPTLDGMGPAGDLDHSTDECIITESLFERVQLTALLIAKHFIIS